MENLLINKELEEIDDFIESVVENQEHIEDEEKQRFKIENLDSANWAFRKLKALDEKENEIKGLAQKELDRINSWKDSELKATQSSREFFEGLLTEYYISQKQIDSKFKLTTPYGKVTSRKQQPKWIYDDDKILEWLKENDKELIRVKEEVDKAGLKKKYKRAGNLNIVVDESGEIVEGITIEERNDSISIKVVE